MKVYFGSDHHGAELRPKLVSYVTGPGYECEDLGMNTDFPLIAQKLTKKVFGYKSSIGILICGSGQGVAMATNRLGLAGIRAAMCNTVIDAKQAREHLDANILAIGADRVKYPLAIEIVDAFLSTKFAEEERYVRRLKQME